MRLFGLLIFIIIGQLGYAQYLQLCFKSKDTTNIMQPIQLSFNVIDKEWSSAFVQYKNEQGGILLKFLSEKIINEIPDNPWQVEYTFNEIVNGKVNGKYIISVQGANVIYFYYTNKSKKNKIYFEQDYSLVQHCGCDW